MQPSEEGSVTPVKTKEELKAMKEVLEEAVDADDTVVYDAICDDANWAYLCTVLDTLCWALGEVSSEDFLSDAYLDLEALKQKAQQARRDVGRPQNRQ